MTESFTFEPGLYKGLPNADYHTAKGISKSGLDLIARSPSHYKDAFIDGNRGEQTPAMKRGTRIHTAILEPKEFARLYRQLPPEIANLNRRTNAGKERYAEFMADVPFNVEFLDNEEWDETQAIIEKVRNHPLSAALLSGGEAEISAFWKDPESGVLCKCRPDYFRSNGVIVDVKTTQDASLREFEKSVANYRYHVAAAWYLDGMKIAGSEYDPTHFVFLAIESKAPFEVAIYQANEAMIDKGRELYKADLAKYAACLAKNEWPGYAPEIVQIGLPSWAW